MGCSKNSRPSKWGVTKKRCTAGGHDSRSTSRLVWKVKMRISSVLMSFACEAESEFLDFFFLRSGRSLKNEQSILGGFFVVKCKKNFKKITKILILPHTRMVTVLRRLGYRTSKSVKCNWRYHGRQFEKRGFEKTSCEVLRLYETTKEVLALKALYLLKRFELQEILSGGCSQIYKQYKY